MRALMLGFGIIALTFAVAAPSPAFANEKKKGVQKVVQGKQCTFDACVARGIARGRPEFNVRMWCMSNNNGC